MNAKLPVTRDITHTILSVLFIGLLIAGSIWIMLPFLTALIWAALVVIATWPVLEKLEARFTGKRGRAVTLMTLVLLLTVLIPIALAVIVIIGNAETIKEQARSLTTLSLSAPPDWIEHVPLAGEKLEAKWMEFSALSPEERSARVVPYVHKAFEWFVAKTGGIGMTILQFLLTVIIAAILYAKGEVVEKGILSFARRLAGQQGEEVTVLAAKTVRSVMLGVVVTALIQSAVGGCGLLIAGVPAAGLLTALMFMLSLAQLGPVLVLVPAVIWVYWSGEPVRGTVLLVISVIAVLLDNILRPFLIKKGADLPLVLIFSGVIGGLIAFGVIGLFIGPVVLAVTYTLLKVWVSGSAQEEAACTRNSTKIPG